MQSGLRELAHAVLLRAVKDLSVKPVAGVQHEVGEKEVDDAWAFCTRTTGAWADARRFWCDCAGVSEQRLRAYAATLAVPAAKEPRSPRPAVVETRRVFREHVLDTLKDGPATFQRLRGDASPTMAYHVIGLLRAEGFLVNFNQGKDVLYCLPDDPAVPEDLRERVMKLITTEPQPIKHFCRKPPEFERIKRVLFELIDEGLVERTQVRKRVYYSLPQSPVEQPSKRVA